MELQRVKIKSLDGNFLRNYLKLSQKARELNKSVGVPIFKVSINMIDLEMAIKDRVSAVYQKKDR